MAEVALGSVIGIVAALVGAYFGARWNAQHVERLEGIRRAHELEAEAQQLKAAARLVLVELRTTAMAAENAVQQGNLLPLKVISTTAWTTHGVRLAQVLPAEVYDQVATAAARAMTVGGLAAATPVEDRGPADRRRVRHGSARHPVSGSAGGAAAHRLSDLATRRFDAERGAGLARAERHRDQLGLAGARRVVGVPLRRRDVPVAHPLLQRPHRHAGGGARGAERVPQVVNAVRDVEPRRGERLAVTAVVRRLAERPASVRVRRTPGRRHPATVSPGRADRAPRQPHAPSARCELSDGSSACRTRRARSSAAPE